MIAIGYFICQFCECHLTPTRLKDIPKTTFKKRTSILEVLLGVGLGAAIPKLVEDANDRVLGWVRQSFKSL